MGGINIFYEYVKGEGLLEQDKNNGWAIGVT
jgi:hypothetical protein